MDLPTKSKPGELTRPPFTAYDFFGYLAPAVVLFICIFLFESASARFASDYHHPFLAALRHLTPQSDPPAYLQTALILVAVLAAYVCGHVIASFGSIILDRIMVAKAHGYPVEQLLISTTPSHRLRASQFFYRNVAFYGNGILWVFVWCVMRDVAEFKFLLFATASFFLTCFLYIYLVARIATHTDDQRFACLATIMAIFAFPYNFGWRFLARVFSWDKSLHPSIRDQYQKVFERFSGISCNTALTENYWFSTLFVQSKSSPVFSVLTNWLHLYSFSRNVAAAFYLAFLYGALSLILLKFFGADVGPRGLQCLFGTLALFFCASVLMAIRYYYLYFNYYSKHLYRSVVFLDRIQTSTASDLETPDGTQRGSQGNFLQRIRSIFG